MGVAPRLVERRAVGTRRRRGLGLRRRRSRRGRRQLPLLLLDLVRRVSVGADSPLLLLHLHARGRRRRDDVPRLRLADVAAVVARLAGARPRLPPLRLRAPRQPERRARLHLRQPTARGRAALSGVPAYAPSLVPLLSPPRLG